MPDSRTNASPPAAPIAPNPAALERLTSALAALAKADRSGSLPAHLAVGEALLAAFYDGRLEVWNRSHLADGRSLTKVVETLARLGYPGIRPELLRRCVKLHEQDLFHGGLRKRWALLFLTHFEAVQSVPLVQQAPLLDQTSAGAISASALTTAVRQSPGRRPRTPTDADAVYHSVELLLRALGDHDHWLAQLRRIGLEGKDEVRFDAAFDRITRELEAFVLTLGELGADVPVPVAKALRAREKQRSSSAS